MSHTPTPWRIGEWQINHEARGGASPRKRSWKFVAGDEVHAGVSFGEVRESPDPPATSIFGEYDGDFYSSYRPLTEGDLAFIIRAVNSHDELVAACELLYKCLQSGPQSITTAEIASIQQAIAGAKGETP